MFGGKLATVWSAPNYCHRYENLASVLELDEYMNEHFNVFEDSPLSTREKKIDKERDVYSEYDSSSTRASFRSTKSLNRNGGY